MTEQKYLRFFRLISFSFIRSSCLRSGVMSIFHFFGIAVHLKNRVQFLQDPLAVFAKNKKNEVH